MAVRNGMPYLTQTLTSIEQQTITPHALLVWVNGSDDGTLEELRRWIPARIKGQVISERPLGLGGSRAALVEMAQTELCAWSDADDLSHPRRIEKQVEFLAANPDAVLVGSQISVIDEQGRPIDRRDQQWAAPVSDAEVRWATRWRPKNLQPSWMFRRDAVLKVGNYRELRAEDTELLMRLSLVGKMPNHPEPLLQYRRHGNNTSAGSSNQIFREAASMNAESLFPGLSAREAMRLWDVGENLMTPARTRVSDVVLLRRASRGLAEAVGQDRSYFRCTELYQHQEYQLRHRCLRSAGFGPLLEWKRRFQRTLLGRSA